MKARTIQSLRIKSTLFFAFLLLSGYSIAQTTFTESAALYGLNIGDGKDGGHAWADYDLDGDLDLLVNRWTSSVLLRNQLVETGTSSFVDVTALLTDGMTFEMERSAIFADFNNDGYPDFARNSGSSNGDIIEIRLQHPPTHRFGDGLGGTAPFIFGGVSTTRPGYILIEDGANSEGMVAFDFDQDGDLDIAFDNHNFGIDLLINDGNGNFSHGTPRGPGYDENNSSTWPFGLAQHATDGDYSSGTDYDNDGLVDIISRKRDEVDFFRNIGGAFSTTSIDIDQANNNNKGGISFYDFDNDGDFDLFWTENGDNQIHENRNGTYVPLGSSTGIPMQFSGDTIEGLACGDVDNDGDIDIFLAGKDGYLYINQINSSAGANTGSPMTFIRDTATNFFNGTGNGEGCTFVDIDRDGDLDLYANKSNGVNELYINNLSNANSDKYLYVDIIENRDLYDLTGIEQRYAVGATARIVDCNGVVISGLREVNGGNGHGTQDPQRIHFGLPYGADQEFIVEVFFPTGPDGRKVIRYSFVPNALGTGWERVAVFTPDMETPNGAPVAVDDDYQYPNDTDTVIINPVENDTDPESEPIQIISIEQPDHGTAVLNGDGTISFTPEVGYCGPSVMNYTAEDIAACRIFSKTDTATITLTIDTTPAANDDSFVVEEDIPNNSFNVLDNDDFKCDGLQANTAITNVGTPANGVVSINDNGTPANPLDDYLLYTPNPYFNGSDSFTYEITDGNGTVDAATVNITVNPDTSKNLEILTNNIVVDEAVGLATITVRITGNYQVGPTINFVTADNSATAGIDYTAVSASHTFVGNDGEVFDIEVPIIDDSIIENTELIDIEVNSTSYSAPINLATDITITDNDRDPSLGVQFDLTSVDVDEDAGTVALDVVLNTNVQDEFTVEYYTVEGTAISPEDYTGVAVDTQTLTFGGANPNTQTITITIIDDTIIESNEDFQVVLTDISTTLVDILADDTATVTIIDNDRDPSLGVQFDLTSVDVDEDAGTVALDVVLNTNVQDEFTVEYYTVEGTAISPEDYTGVPVDTQTLTFGGANPNTQTITITIIDDTIIESNEDFQVVLTDISTTLVDILANDTATVTIIDNDGNEGWPVDITLEACDTIPTAFDITTDSACAITVDFNEDIVGQDDGCSLDYTITRTWTITDCVGNIRVHTQTITIEDTNAPTFVEALPGDRVVSCDAVPDADVITAVDSCDPNITVILDEQISDESTCGTAYTLTRTWTAADCAGNSITHVQVITVQDTTAPTFVEALPQDSVVMCNEVPDAITLTAIDNCDTEVSVAFQETISNNANCVNGYTVTRIWTTTDCSGNTNSHTQQITIQPAGPITASPYDEEVTLMCGEELPEVPELTFMGGCGNYDVEFTEDTTFLEETDDYMIVRTWEVTDSCGNTATFEQTIFIMQYQPEEITITICVEDSPIDLRDYLPEPFDKEGTFVIQQGNAVLEGSVFNPANLEVGEYLISYSAQNGTCSYFAEFFINVNSDCVPCGRDEIIVSSAVTANGDGINDMFEITGVEYCNYTFDVMIFNRWGDKVFEAKTYENDWGGFAPNNAFGTSGLLPAGTYFYIIKVNERPEFEPFNGYIYLGSN